MDYNNSIVKKAKYKNFISFDLDVFTCNLRSRDKKAINTWQDVEESSFMTWNLSISQYTKFNEMYNHESMLNEALDYIITKTNIEKENIDQDAVILDIMTACDYAYQDDYITKLFKFTQKSIISKINNLNIDGQLLYYSKEDNTLHNELKYNTSEIRLYISIKTIKQLNIDYFRGDYTRQEVIDNIADELDQKSLTINYEYFDYYGTVAGYDNWMDAFKDNESITHSILKDRQVKISKLKNKILNKVELCYR